MRVRKIDLDADKPIVVLNEKTARQLHVLPGERVEIRCGDQSIIGIVDLSKRLVKEDEIGLFEDLWGSIPCKEVDVFPTPDPKSLQSIRRKIFGENLSENEIFEIIEDIMANKLTTAETMAFIVACQINGTTMEETVALTKAIAASGPMLSFEGKVVDKHCIGGIPNNRVTPIVVPIMAALGYKIPKLSSRAITSPAGTADTMEVLTRVDLSAEEIKGIVERVGGVMAWGGGTGIAAADDRLIAVRRSLSLDPKGLLLSSIMAKKYAVSAKYLIVDIPVGDEAKVKDIKHAEELAEDFVVLGKLLGMKVKVILTDGSAPIGRGVGPALEAIDILEIMGGSGPRDLKEKGLEVAAHLLSFVEGMEFSKAYKVVRDALDSGRAEKKFKEIIEAQGGDPDIKPEDIEVGKEVAEVFAERDGKVVKISNYAVAKTARTAGAPTDKGAGVLLLKKVGEKVKKGEVLARVYSNSAKRLDAALQFAKDMYHIG